MDSSIGVTVKDSSYWTTICLLCVYCLFQAQSNLYHEEDSGYLPTFIELDQYVEKVFIPALIDGHIPNNVERKLLSSSVKLGAMGIVIFADDAKTEYQNSRNIPESLTKLYLEQTTEYNINRDELAKLKYNIKKEKFAT